MIAVQNLELRAGARLLMEEVTFRIDKGDKIGLVCGLIVLGRRDSPG